MCHVQEGQLKEALNAALEIKHSDAHNEIKIELLDRIQSHCGTGRDEIKGPAIRALKECKGRVA